MNLKENQKVLDIGCGIGGSAFYMAKVRINKWCQGTGWQGWTPILPKQKLDNTNCLQYRNLVPMCWGLISQTTW